MKTMALHLWRTILCGMLVGTLGTASLAFALTPPKESLAGLTPGKDTLADARRLHGRYDIQLPGETEFYVGGSHASTAYRWTVGTTLGRTGLAVETATGSTTISVVQVDFYPGLGTSNGVTALVSDSAVRDAYGMPDAAFELTIEGTKYQEIYYLDRGLLFIMGQVSGRPNWTVTKIILTYPTYLSNAVTQRSRYAAAGKFVEDITYIYRVWARMALPPD